ncbi:MAG: hypothetical protein N0C84_03450 [Candidatus Thiodiazotropha taylori]|uniref:SnoaL-like domain-containing protein n=1 Tax=Candidatus Thiodiazotropha taylori TaxID=2792791 RepID=A0A9E4N2J2_9GAMM|nr:hypothetical protein [Candidatus Thiodiazotropha taylori]MCW4255503.1 hypothetical protein [Candidatus Thiodiazotropha taylori]
MKPIELVEQYMEIFFESKEFDSLRSIFSENLDFEGPLFKSNSAAEYIASLKSSPPVDVGYEMLAEFNTDTSVCLIYRFIKNGKSTLMAQTFWFVSGRINKIRLIFNPQELA